ncbi:MAG: hypothetical protein KF773_41045, partial [Deltaproteobacteria bacterium]|nr:hypothetical protein [Deltaproteobacteria bacterium]
MMDIHASRLQFTRDGRGLVVAEPDRIVVVDLARDVRRELAIHGVRSLAAFADQLWAATAAGALHRWSLDGQPLDDAPIALGGEGALVPATVGGAAALWTGARPAMWLDDLGRLTSVAADDGAIPIAGRRCARAAGARLTLPAGHTATLDGVERILGGCAIFEGTCLALVARHAGAHEVRVVAVASGRQLQAIALPPGEVRIAPRRGVAVVRSGRDLALVDLRLGRPLGTVVADRDLADAAVDPDATQLALRATSGEVELLPLARHERARRRDRPAEPERETEPEVAAVAVELALAEPEPVRLARAEPEVPPDLAIDAFEPRPARAELPRPAAAAALRREIRAIALRTARAIAAAWNTRRIGYGDEAAHPYEHEVAALTGANSGFATEYLDAADRAVAGHAAELAADPHHRAAPTPVATLADEFGLSPAALDILLVIAAPSIDGDIARLYGILANDGARAIVDELLVEHILAPSTSREEIGAELDADAPLVRFGLVACRGGRARPFASLEVDPVVLARLRGKAPHLGRAVQVRAADRDLRALDLPAPTLASA